MEGRLDKELCALTSIDKSRTTPHHPMGNGNWYDGKVQPHIAGYARDFRSTEETERNWKLYVAPIVRQSMLCLGLKTLTGKLGTANLWSH